MSFAYWQTFRLLLIPEKSRFVRESQRQMLSPLKSPHVLTHWRLAFPGETEGCRPPGNDKLSAEEIGGWRGCAAWDWKSVPRAPPVTEPLRRSHSCSQCELGWLSQASSFMLTVWTGLALSSRAVTAETASCLAAPQLAPCWKVLFYRVHLCYTGLVPKRICHVCSQKTKTQTLGEGRIIVLCKSAPTT